MPQTTSNYNPSNLVPTGHRKFKYRIIRRALNDHKAQEEALNKFAGHGYQLIKTREDSFEKVKLNGKEVEGVVYFTLQRRTRPLAR